MTRPTPTLPARGPQPRPEFVALTRDPNLPPPERFEPTVKRPGEVIVTPGGLVRVGEDHV